MRLRDRLGVSERRQYQLSRLMQFCLVGVLFVGLDRGNLGIVVNAGLALALTHLPAILERDYDLPMDSGLVLWLTTAVFLHAVGTLGPYGAETGLLGYWDHLTHALSSSLVAAAGYTFARAVDEHTEHVDLPPTFMFVFLVLVVLAFGVFWEVVEFAVSEIARALGSDSVLTQYGLDDTMLDLVFNTIGAVLVAVWGTAYLTDVAEAVRSRIAGGRDASDGE
ncbi:hypothetical protein [Halospeciosus flavus]|uniref:DUF2238 domain-containing protein n=1 Tax=Halospeciosus flavus TaxID=3032283 RepID=A0ABD5Z8X2_9EURY|nr:hypothetical protein [Halospeciosus flavus]